MLHILPQIDQQGIYDLWNFDWNVRANGEIGVLTPDLEQFYPPLNDVPAFYCPSRRGSMQATGSGAYSLVERIQQDWDRGGNDYAGCSGSGITFADLDEEERQTYRLTSAQLEATEVFQVVNGVTITTSPYTQHPRHVGVFGVNSSTAIRDIRDGTSKVIMVAERRIFTDTTINPDPTIDPVQLRSQDGWAWGGPATMFSTRDTPHTGDHFDEADSVHDQVVHVLLADGSVQGISFNIDQQTWRNLGNMAQGSPVDFVD